MDKRAILEVKTYKSKKDHAVSKARNTDFFQPKDSILAPIIFLHRTLGNQALQRLFRSRAIQAKFEVKHPGNIFDQKSDSVAEQVIGMPTSQIQSKPPSFIRVAKPSIHQFQQTIDNPDILPLLPSNMLYRERIVDATLNMERLKRKVWFCPPLADSYANILKMTGEEGLLGYTKIDQSSNLICTPKFNKSEGKEKGYTFKNTTVRLATTSKYIKAEEFPSDKKMKLPECGEKEVSIYFKITKEIETLAKAGEQEHCDDLSLAFHQTLKPCAEALNKYSGTKFVGNNEDECYKNLVARLGFDPINCTEEFIRLSKKTDDRDDKGWHTFDLKLISKDCKKIVVGFKKSKTNKIGDTSLAPSKHILSTMKCGSKKP